MLPFDYYFCQSLLSKGFRVTVFASETSYNPEFLAELKNDNRVEVRLWRVSSTVAGRILGTLEYAALLFSLIVASRRFERIYYNFPQVYLLEFLVFAISRSRLVYCVHNAVPHGHPSSRHWGTHLLAANAKRLLFLSRWAKHDFLDRYGLGYDRVSSVLQHGVMAINPQHKLCRYRATPYFSGVAFWGNIKPYKGIELFRLNPGAWLPERVEKRYVIAGKWDRQLDELKSQYSTRDDIDLLEGFLAPAEVERLVKTDLVFVLPYKQASQSGVLYTLLFYGRYFIATDRGDVGDFLRLNNLSELIIADFSENELRRAISWLVENLDYVRERLNHAQDTYTWKYST